MTEFKRETHIFADRALQGFQLALSFEEATSNIVGEQSIASFFELFDFASGELNARMLLLMQFLALFIHGLILQARFIVFKKCFHAVGESLECGIFRNRSTKLAGFYHHSGVIG